MTKIAFRSESPDTLRQWLESHRDLGEAHLTTRYLPKRLDEMTGGSLFWIHGHMLVGRSPIIGFQEAPEGRHWIRLEPRLIAVHVKPKRAHQGWRYLADAEAPTDLGGDVQASDIMPPALIGELARLGLV